MRLFEIGSYQLKYKGECDMGKKKIDIEKTIFNILDLCKELNRIPIETEIYERKLISDIKILSKYAKDKKYKHWIEIFHQYGYKRQDEIKINNTYKLSKDITIEELYILFKEYFDKTVELPNSHDIKIENNLPTYLYVNKLLKQNNITLRIFYKLLCDKYNINPKLEDYKMQLNKFIEISNQRKTCLTVKDLIRNEYGLPTSRWFINNCPNKNVKTYADFIEFAGLKPNLNISKELAISIIYDMQDNLNRPLMLEDFIYQDSNCIGIGVIKRYWGTMNNMKKELGLEIVQENMLDKTKSKDIMIEELQSFIKELGRLPLRREINENKNMVNSQSYDKYFGSLDDLYIYLGYIPNKKSIALHMTNQEIIDMYKEFIEKNNYVPSVDFISNIYTLPSTSTIMRRFNCSWNEFIEFLGYNPNSSHSRNNICYANDGTKCLSSGECYIHNYILDNYPNCTIKKEILYKDIVSNEYIKLWGLKRCDWIIFNNDKNYIVEFFGFTGDKLYDVRTNDKLNLIKESKIQDNFIAIYPKDLKCLNKVFSVLNN